MIRKTVIALSAAVLMAAPLCITPAFAETSQPSMHVSLAGKSTAQAHDDIVKAAGQVCRLATRDELLSLYLYSACLDDTVSDAVARVGDPALSAYVKAHPVTLASR